MFASFCLSLSLSLSVSLHHIGVFSTADDGGGRVGGSRVVVVFHRLFARNHQRLIAEGKLLANTAGNPQKEAQKRGVSRYSGN